MNELSFHSKLKSLNDWQSPHDWLKITTVEAHTGGEPLRIITGGLPEIKGNTVLEKRRYMKENLDHFRKILMWEPRGHADMYGCIILPPVSKEADFAVLFLHNEGYSTMCGHGIIAVAKTVLACGMFPVTEPETCLKIDSPAGLITAYAKINNGKIGSIYFHNVPSFVAELQQTVDVEGLGKVQYDLAFGGAFYAYVNAKDVGLALTSQEYQRIITVGMAVKRSVSQRNVLNHPREQDLNYLYGVIFTNESSVPGVDIRNVCVFADGEVDRSPTGTGVSGRLALEHAKGKLNPGETMTIESITGSIFKCRIKSLTTVGPYQAVVPEVEGTAHIYGFSTFIVDPEDPLKGGFIFR